MKVCQNPALWKQKKELCPKYKSDYLKPTNDQNTRNRSLLRVRKDASNFISRLMSLSRRSGIRYVFTFRGFINLLCFLYSRKIKGHNSFSIGTKTYNYFDTFSKGGGSWYNERAVEIAVAMDIVRRYKGKNILEIGNVLSHYFTFEHDICDKYEGSQRSNYKGRGRLSIR